MSLGFFFFFFFFHFSDFVQSVTRLCIQLCEKDVKRVQRLSHLFLNVVINIYLIPFSSRLAERGGGRGGGGGGGES